MAAIYHCVPIVGRLWSEVIQEKDEEIERLKAANATAQKRLAAKQAVVDQVCKERDEAKSLAKSHLEYGDGQLKRAESLWAEVAKLKGDLAQAIVPDPSCVFVPADPQGCKRLRDCAAIARGEPVDNEDSKSIAVKAVRKLRADYEYEKKRGDTMNGQLALAQNHLKACEGIAKGDGASWTGCSPAVDAVLSLRQRYTKAKEALA